MREEVAMIQHVNPYLAVGQNRSVNSVLYNLSGRHRNNDRSLGFEVVLCSLPCKFETVFESLNCSLLLQQRELTRPILQGIFQHFERSFKIAQSLFPANIGSFVHAASLLHKAM